MPKILIGNGGEITFDKDILEAVNIKAGDDVLIQESEEGIIISKADTK